jgi:hypothetical protein
LGVCVGRRVAVSVGVTVGVFVDVGVGVIVAVSVGVAVEVGVSDTVNVEVGVAVSVGVAVALLVLVGVAVGDWQKVETDAGAVPPPEVSSSKVPKSPLVLMVMDAPAFNWKVLDAMGELFSKRVQVPRPVMLLPMLVMMNVPCASGVQFAERDRTGGFGVGVGVGDWQKVEVDAGAVPPPEVSSSNVPKSPLVLMVKDWPAFSWKELEAMGVLLSNSVHVPGLSMLLPTLVMVNVP